MSCYPYLLYHGAGRHLTARQRVAARGVAFGQVVDFFPRCMSRVLSAGFAISPRGGSPRAFSRRAFCAPEPPAAPIMISVKPGDMRLHHDVGSICHVTPDFLRHFTTAFAVTEMGPSNDGEARELRDSAIPPLGVSEQRLAAAGGERDTEPSEENDDVGRSYRMIDLITPATRMICFIILVTRITFNILTTT